MDFKDSVDGLACKESGTSPSSDATNSSRACSVAFSVLFTWVGGGEQGWQAEATLAGKVGRWQQGPVPTQPGAASHLLCFNGLPVQAAPDVLGPGHNLIPQLQLNLDLSHLQGQRQG